MNHEDLSIGMLVLLNVQPHNSEYDDIEFLLEDMDPSIPGKVESIEHSMYSGDSAEIDQCSVRWTDLNGKELFWYLSCRHIVPFNRGLKERPKW